MLILEYFTQRTLEIFKSLSRFRYLGIESIWTVKSKFRHLDLYYIYTFRLKRDLDIKI